MFKKLFKKIFGSKGKKGSWRNWADAWKNWWK
jgi:hypothetical protein